jgi:hypothetical protein
MRKVRLVSKTFFGSFAKQRYRCDVDVQAKRMMTGSWNHRLRNESQLIV